MFEVSYGSEKRIQRIEELSESEATLALILAAVHFEWTIKRCILKLGCLPTVELRSKLENVPSLRSKKKNLRDIWNAEIAQHYKKAKFGQVVGSFNDISNKALQVRGELIHGNGTTSNSRTREAISIFLKSSRKIYAFAQANDIDLDARLKPRRKILKRERSRG